jgi:membrane protein YdbS with pleckstrin-like domain
MAQHQKGIFMEYVDDDEVLLGTIHKHPFGIIILYIEAIVSIILLLGLAFVLLPTVVNSDSAVALATTFGLLAILLATVIMIVATIIYRQSRIVVTDKNITQVIQAGLFNRKVSQLTMANVEDVTAEQRGIFSTLFDFGNLRVETAGEQANFVFGYCPRPGYYAKIILEAREKFISHEFPYAGAYKGQMQKQQATTDFAQQAVNAAGPDPTK